MPGIINALARPESCDRTLACAARNAVAAASAITRGNPLASPPHNSHERAGALTRESFFPNAFDNGNAAALLLLLLSEYYVSRIVKAPSCIAAKRRERKDKGKRERERDEEEDA